MTEQQILTEALAPEQPQHFSEGFNIDRMHDLKDIREALANQAVVRAVSAILVEHQRAVREYPEWPGDLVQASAILSNKAVRCHWSASRYPLGLPTDGGDSLLAVEVKAIQAGAMAVRLLENHPRKVAQR